MPKVNNSRVSGGGTGTIQYTDSDDAVVESSSSTQTYNPVKGDRGPQGIPGVPGANGNDGEDGRGILTVLRTMGNGAPGTNDTYTITYTDFTTSNFTVHNGADGQNGLSAFQIAVQNGFNGDVVDWLLSLVGQPGNQGVQGLSAYEVAVQSGFEGTIEEWLESLIGAPGTPGTNGQQGIQGPVGPVGPSGGGSGAEQPFIWFNLSSNFISSELSYPALRGVGYQSPAEGEGYAIGEVGGGGDYLTYLQPAQSGLYEIELDIVANHDAGDEDQNSVVRLDIDSQSDMGPIGYVSIHHLSLWNPFSSEEQVKRGTLVFKVPMNAAHVYRFRLGTAHGDGMWINNGSNLKISRIGSVYPLPGDDVDISPVTFELTAVWTPGPGTLSLNLQNTGNDMDRLFDKITGNLIAELITSPLNHENLYTAKYTSVDYPTTDYTNFYCSAGFDQNGDSMVPGSPLDWPTPMPNLYFSLKNVSDTDFVFYELVLPVTQEMVGDQMRWAVTVDMSDLSRPATAEQIEIV